MLTAEIKGTLSELLQLWPHELVMEMLHIDPYKTCLVSEHEEFIITERDLIRVGVFKPK